ncbi:MAG: hypothetical protein HY329_19990 [Chloroflexi bacterium]|nr:hypothetical protein [Chloroflexota bacterium]
MGDLAPRDVDRMHTLLADYFQNVDRGRFEEDLAEKRWVIILRDAITGRLEGFSTLMELRASLDGEPVVAYFSGDTIVGREHWGQTALARLWARHAFGLAAEVPVGRVYWLLISSGYKTYRYLSTFFREFYPTYERPTPAPIKRTLDALASQKFPSEYDVQRGIVRLSRAAPLRPGVAEVTDRRLSDPHVAFFVAANPGHRRGDELVCLTELTPANLTPAGQRMLTGRDIGGAV